MVDCYISANSQYAYENEKYYKNGAVITNDTGNVVDEITFKSLIKKETSTFIHKSFSNIIVLVGAGASVLCNSGNIDSRFGKTVFMLAKLIQLLKMKMSSLHCKNCRTFVSIIFL